MNIQEFFRGMENMLNTYKKIVVPFDNSELSKKALETAITLAKYEENIELDVIMVVDTVNTFYYYDPVRETVKKEAKEALNEVEQKLKDLPNKTKTLLI